jgi:hypothetical protein
LLLQCALLSRITSCLLLLCFWLSIITSYYVLAATLWGFKRDFWVRFCCEVFGFAPQSRPIMFVAAMPLVSRITSFYVLSATPLGFGSYVATLLTFSFFFLLRSCCYALGFPA